MCEEEKVRKQRLLETEMLLDVATDWRDKTLASGFYEGREGDSRTKKKNNSQIVVVLDVSKSVCVFVTLESAREREGR